MRFTLSAGTLVTPTAVHRPGWLTIDQAVISALGAGRPPTGPVLDLGDRVVTPGFVDLHVHGALGHQVNGTEPAGVAEAVRQIAGHHATRGTTSWLATTVSDTPKALLATVIGIGEAMRQPERSAARILGAHLEGPWLAASRAGAHERRHLRAPDESELAAWRSAAPGVVRMVTLAPELSGALDMIDLLTSLGVVASVGHTEADTGEAKAAFDAGACHVTHLFNAMPGLHHRDPGPVGAALADDRVTVELIPDGHHVHASLLAPVMRAAPGRVAAVTDAISATGLPAGSPTMLGGVEIVAHGDRLVLRDDPQTIAGSRLTMDHAVAGLVAAGVPLLDAVNAGTAVPAAVLGEAEIGRLRVGARADLVVLGSDLTCQATVIGGRVAHDPNGLLEQAVRAFRPPGPTA